VLTTARLLLPPLTRADAVAVVAGDRAGRAWSPGYPTAGDLVVAGLLVQAPVGTLLDPAFGPLRVVLRAGGTVVGGVGFHGPPDADGGVEVGYGLAEEARGQGLATEAVLAVLAVLPALPGVPGDPAVRVVLGRTAPGNVASQRVLERCGFGRETGGPDADGLLRWVLPLSR